MSHTIERLRLTVSGVSFALAPTEHIDAIKAAVTNAVRSGGGFVDVTLDDGHRLSALLTSSSVVTILNETIRLDSGRADGEEYTYWSPGLPSYDGDSPYDII